MTHRAKKHSKKRNVGLIYEFLVHYISKSLVENDDRAAGKSLEILKRHYVKGSQLYKEFRLFKALIATRASSVGVASTILREAKKAVIEHDPRRLDREKSLLIRDINHGLNDPTFYKQSIPEYTMYATVQTLMNDWRAPSTANLVRVAEYEDKVINWLTRPEQINEDDKRFADVDGFVVKLMTERLNNKYVRALNKRQSEIIRLYALTGGPTSDHQNKLSTKLQEIKDSSLELIDAYIDKNPRETYVNEKLMNIHEGLRSLDFEELNDAKISTLLSLVGLNEELISGDENDAG